MVPLAHNLVRLYLLLVRLKVVNEELVLNHLASGRKGVAALWHQRFFGVLGYAKKFSNLAPSVIISHSRDGEWIAQVVMRLGFHPIRGSSSRGGEVALAEIVKYLAVNSCAVHAVDGPQGPKGIVKAGLIRIAQLSGAAIFPLYLSCSRAWVLGSWDRFLIPKPFSQLLVRWGDPIYVPPNLKSEEFEALRLEVEAKMIQGHAQDDLNFGWKEPL